MSEFFVTGVFRDLPALGKADKAMALLGQGLKREKPEKEWVCTPKAIASAFSGDSRIIGAYAAVGKQVRLVAWIQMVHSELLFQPSFSRLGMYWIDDRQMNNNIFLCLLRTTKQVVRETWGDQFILGYVVDRPFEGFVHDGPIIDDIRSAGGNTNRLLDSSDHWGISLDTKERFVDTKHGIPSEKKLCPKTLETEFRWHLSSRVVREARIPPRQPAEFGYHTMGEMSDTVDRLRKIVLSGS